MEKIWVNAMCANCAGTVLKSYNLSATRRAAAMYCSRECRSAASARRRDEKRKTYFWTKVAVGATNDCWEWRGFRDDNGYGRYGRILAHRIAYELATGSQAGAHCVCHTCDNPPCCNPHHFFLGTQVDNIRDMDAKGRRVTAAGRRGEDSNRAKITGAQALEIFQSAASNSQLSERYGITSTAVYYIKTGRNWRHLTGSANG